MVDQRRCARFCSAYSAVRLSNKRCLIYAIATVLRMLLLIFILSSCIGCDQATKHIATEALESQPAKTFFHDTVRLELAANPGGFLKPWKRVTRSSTNGDLCRFQCLMMLAVTSFLLLKKNVPLSLFLALSLVLAGGIGNLIDRVSNNGLVTDFINLGLGPIERASSTWPISP